ncbi:hypothetical protein NE865_02769 [Phthorimaea operculella]|nr:hypothetical protein NE865_02769 [Phthorimaea operculella]
MEHLNLLLILSCLVVCSYAWSAPYHPHRSPHRFIRHVRQIRQIPIRPLLRPYRVPVAPVREPSEEPQRQRAKRGHDFDVDHDHHYDRDHRGITGPVHTFVKTDKNANYKWGVRHHVGNKFAS